MRRFQAINLDLDVLASELDELEQLLRGERQLRERTTIAPFFKAKTHLSAALGLTNSAVLRPDRVASELALFGDFVCDGAAGDSEQNAYTLVEFEDATEFGIFARAGEGKPLRAWSSRFEHGFSQLVDWAWRLATEGATTEAYRRLFGGSNATIHFLLLIGRDADLEQSELDRLAWRSNNVLLGGHRMTCLTFDQVLASTRRRMAWPRGR